MRLGIFLTALLYTLKTFAQDEVEVLSPTPQNDTIRERYIKHFPDHFFVYPLLKQRSLSFEFEKRNGDDMLTFKPNNSLSLGVGAYLFEVGLSLTLAVPVDEKSRSLYGASKTRDIQVNIFNQKWGLDVFYQKYSGFYVSDQDDEPPPGISFPQRPDIRTRNFALTGYYLFNNKKFSFRAVYNFAERQLYSKGSLLVLCNIGAFRLSADSSVLTEPQEQVFGENVSFKRLRYTTFSIAPGYTYSLIFKSFFLNGTLAVGPAYNWIYYKLDNDAENNEIAINSFAAARIGIGYNGDRLFGGITFSTQGSQLRFGGTRFSNNNGEFKVLIGYRFREFGPLKKKFWDLIPIRF